MKKFFVTFFILLILAGAVFLLGWAHLSVPPGSYGVIISKTHGVDPIPVQSGEFRWLWYKLIPTNVKISVFRLDSVKHPINFNSSLPSGDIYISFAGLNIPTSQNISGISNKTDTSANNPVNFSWDIKAILSFKVDPDKLVQTITKNNIIDQDSLDYFIQNKALNIEAAILRSLSSIASNPTEIFRLEKILSGSPDEILHREISEQFPEICDFSFTIQSARFPDFLLYREMRQLYESFLLHQREVITAGFAQRAESHIAARLLFDELERYGELITRYPVLLEYLAMRNSINND